MEYANCFADPKLGSISSLQCQKSRRRVRWERACEVMFSRTIVWRSGFGQPVFALSSFDAAAFALLSRVAAPRVANGEAWWSQTGSNRRPHACKARALPAELWPRTRRRMLHMAIETHLINEKTHSIKVVGLGRLELPTSRLSSARSNQLSYKPLTLFLKKGSGACSRTTGFTPDGQHKRSPWRVFVREERET